MASSDSMRNTPMRAPAQAMRRMGARAVEYRGRGQRHQHEGDVAAEPVMRSK